MRFSMLIGLLALALPPAPGRAQEAMPGCGQETLQLSASLERISDHHLRRTGEIDISCGDMRFSADDALDVYTDTGRLVASGNVVFVQGANQISAERVEFNTKTRTGTFYNAFGIATITTPVERSMFGTQEPLAYFYGETIEKIGDRRYRIRRGGFTTCVQPTPRWEMVSTSATIELGDYALLKHTVLRVKGVPVFYLPVLYYPIQDDDRATGFLIPKYTKSDYRGQSFSNQFFWAIDRSQDATFMHDWFSKTGQGYGGHYRYSAAPGSDGDARIYLLNEHEATYTGDDGVEVTNPALRSHLIQANATQDLGGAFRARARVDYFSDVRTQQTYSSDVYNLTNRRRTYGGTVTGVWGAYTLNGTYDLNEVFFGEEDSTLTGSTPRISFNQGQRRLGFLPMYASYGAEYARLERQGRTGEAIRDSGLQRLDFTPALRIPFTRWPFLTINSYLGYRATRYTESLDETGRQVSLPVWRDFFDLRSEFVGPVLVRVFDTPRSGYAEKFKHVVEPRFEVRRVTLIDNVDRIVKLEGSDYTLGGSTEVRYGVTNRMLAKRRRPGVEPVAREILSVAVTQTYYTDPRVSQVDGSYGTSFLGRPPSKFSPVAVAATTTPYDRTTASLRLEYDHQFSVFRTISGNASSAVGSLVTVSGGYSRRRIGQGADAPLDSFLNASASVRSPANVAGGSYAFHYDIGRSYLVQQRLTGYYNTQCCGFIFEYQTVNFPQYSSRFVIPEDRRFSLGFSLAGIGTFADVFGVFGGAQGR
jgi:LPS-assembly protein